MPTSSAEPVLHPNYKVKEIQEFLGRENVRVLCQNENGPCPLLAIANVLSLRNEIQLPPDEVPNQQLLALVASAILDSSSRASASSEDQANLQANVQDCLDTLEVLGRPGNTGLDVNLRFNSPFGFEFTRELAVFDLLGISLIHGWLVDPQDKATAEALGSCTYNQAVELIISALDGAGSSQAVSRHASFVASRQGTLSRTHNHGNAALPTTPSSTLRPAAAAHEHQEGDLLGLGDTAAAGSSSVGAAAAAPAQQPTPAAAAPAPVDLLGDLLGGQDHPTTPQQAAAAAAAPAPAAAPQQAEAAKAADDALNMFEGLSVQEDAHARPAAAAQQQQQQQTPAATPEKAPPSGVGGGDVAQARRVNQALHVQEFLDLNASQLTVYGISQIASSLPENKLAVFFRNNHFNVLFKHGRSLFLLITDQGYLGVREVVWERLDTVDGDTQLCGPDFLPHKAKAQVPQPASAAAMNMQALAEIPPEALAGLSEADAAAIAEAAGVLLPSAAAGGNGGGGGGNGGATGGLQGSQHASHHQQQQHNEDADLALALQLQEEENRRAEEQEQRRRAQQQQAAAQQQQQQQQQQQWGGQQQGGGGYAYQDGYQPIPQQQQQRQQQHYGGAGSAGQRPPAGGQPGRAAQAPVPPAAQESKKDSSCAIM